MIVRRVCIVSASMALHVAAAVAALLIAGSAVDSAILIDLVANVTGDAPADARPTVGARPMARAEQSQRMRAPRQAPTATPTSMAPMTFAPPTTEERPVPPPAPDVVRANASEAPGESAPVVATTEPGPPASVREARPREGPGRAAAQIVEQAAAAVRSGPAGSAVAGAVSGQGPINGSSGDGSPVAPVDTSGVRGGIPPEYDPYLKRFRRRVQESVSYPLAARRQGLAGTVELEVLLDPSGRIAGVAVVTSSSHTLLDDAALQAVKRVAPEPIPEPLPRRPLRIRLPLAFELQ
jgi:protein TonB